MDWMPYVQTMVPQGRMLFVTLIYFNIFKRIFITGFFYNLFNSSCQKYLFYPSSRISHSKNSQETMKFQKLELVVATHPGV